MQDTLCQNDHTIQVGRFDAWRDVPVKWKWVGVGVSPQPSSKPSHCEIEGNRIALYWPTGGFCESRVLWVCPVCGSHCKHVYRLDSGRMGCRKHVSQARRTKERALLGVKRAAKMARVPRWQKRAAALRAESLALLSDTR